jgi:hypothetical protein
MTSDIALTLQLSSAQLVYLGAENTTVLRCPSDNVAATGTVQIVDGLNFPETETLQGNGCCASPRLRSVT